MCVFEYKVKKKKVEEKKSHVKYVSKTDQLQITHGKIASKGKMPLIAKEPLPFIKA